MHELYEWLKKICFTIEGWFLKFKRGKDVLFVIQNEAIFDYAFSIYQILEEEQGVRFWFCYLDRSGFKDLKLLQKKYPLRWISYRWAEVIKWDLILMPAQGAYFRKDVPIIFSDHGLPVGKMVEGRPYMFGSGSWYEKGGVVFQKIF